MFDAPPMSDMLRRLTNPIRNVRFSELFWSIFAVERLEHAIVLWKLLVCKLCSPSDKSGAFFALDFLLTRRGFSFLSDVERSNFYEPSLRRRVYAYVSHSIDIFTWYFNFVWDSVRDRLKNVKSLSGGNVEGVFLSDVTTSFGRFGLMRASNCDWLCGILGRVTEAAVVMHALPTRDLSVSSYFINFPWRTKAKFPQNFILVI